MEHTHKIMGVTYLGFNSCCFSPHSQLQPICIVAVKCSNCLSNKLRLRTMSVMVLVLLDNEKDIILQMIKETNVRFCMLPFSTNEVRDILLSVSNSVAFHIAKSPKQLNSEVINSCLPSKYRLHCQIKEVDEFSIVV